MRRLIPLVVACGLMVLAGCETIRLGQSLQVNEDAVTTEGGSEAHAHLTTQAPEPPLVQAWRVDVQAGFGPAASLVAGGRVLVSSRIGEVHVLDVGTGRRRGKIELGESIEGAPVLVDGGLLVVPLLAGRYGLVAYDIVNGSRVWRQRDMHQAAGLLLAQGVLIAAALDGTVRGLDPESGVERWAIQPDPRSSFVATPTAFATGSSVAVADDQGRVTTLDPTTGRILWTAELGAPVQETPTAVSGLLVVPTTRGRLIALDAETGAVRWMHQAESETARFAAPASSEAIFVGASDGILRRLDAQTGEVVWTARFDGNVAAAPLIAGELIYVSTLGSTLAALDAETGARVWETELPGRSKSALVAADGFLFVLAEPRYIYAFRNQDALANASR